MNITALCENLNNWFEINGMRESEMLSGTFTISNNKIDLGDFLPENQYFRIVGSVFNDGAHKYGEQNLVDETFVGEIWKMWIPRELIELSKEMDDWQAKYGDAVNSPYTSESFGGYSYSKAGAGDGSNSGTGSNGVWGVFASKLNKWRKI